MSALLSNSNSPSFARDFRLIVQVLCGRAVLIGAIITAAVSVGWLYLKRTANVYEAKTVIQVEQEERKVVKIEGIQSEDLKTLEVLKTYEQSIANPEVLLRVIHNSGFINDPAFLPEVNGSTSDNVLQEALAKHIQVKIRRGTRLIDITVQHGSPAIALRIAELLVPEFTKWSFEARREAGRVASKFLSEEADRLKRKLLESEEAIHSFREQNRAVSLEEKQSIVAEKLKDLNLRVTEAKAARLKLESDCAELGMAAGQLPLLLAIPGIANAAPIVEIQRNIKDREAQFATLTERYKSRHPKYIQAHSELAKLRSNLEQTIAKTAEVLTAEYESSLSTERKLERALVDQQKLAFELNKIAIPYASLIREMESDRVLYESVLTRLKETDVTKGIAQDAVRVVTRPLLPARPVKPRKSLILALSVLAGIVAGCGLAFLLDATDRSLRTSDDVEALLRLRPLGEIPRLNGHETRKKKPVVVHESNGAAGESFRSLRNSLSLLRDVPDRKTFLFTSANPGEGKTFCAINCAASFAQLGLKTLLIDGDLRLPQVDQTFFGGRPVQCFGELLDVNGSWEHSIQRTHIPQLSAMSLPTSSHCLTGDAFGTLIDWAASRYERVVVDSAPVLLVSDTLLLAKHVEAVCLVIRAGQTPADDVHRAVQRLEQAGARVVGFIWNQVKLTRRYYQDRSFSARTRVSNAESNEQQPTVARIEPNVGAGISSPGSGRDASVLHRNS